MSTAVNSITLIFENDDLDNKPQIKNNPHATGFFYQRNENLYLISNWHVFSGRNSNTGQLINQERKMPIKIILDHFMKEDNTQVKSMVYDLYDDESTEQGRWLQHGIKGKEVDIGVLPINVNSSELHIYPINSMNQTDDMEVIIGTEVLIFGFPIEKYFTDMLAICTRGIVSSEPDLQVGSWGDKFLIHAYTFKGMSGSPVIIRQKIFSDTNGNLNCVSGGYATKFLGIYSGRHTDTKLEEDIRNALDNLKLDPTYKTLAKPLEEVLTGKNAVGLGVVWKKHLIDEIIDNGIMHNSLSSW